MIVGMLAGCLSSLHVKLACAVEAAVGSALRGARLSLSQLARSVQSATSMRHRVKRIDRLLGNTSLHITRSEIYREVASRWLTDLDNVLVVIDWSDATTDQRWHLLRASIAVKGRSVTLYEEIHAQRLYGNQAVHRRFLDCLAKLLPDGCTPTLITDAGFHSTWFDLVTEHHWPWIGRIRGKDRVSITEGPWKRCTEFFRMPRRAPKPSTMPDTFVAIRQTVGWCWLNAKPKGATITRGRANIRAPIARSRRLVVRESHGCWPVLQHFQKRAQRRLLTSTPDE